MKNREGKCSQFMLKNLENNDIMMSSKRHLLLLTHNFPALTQCAGKSMIMACQVMNTLEMLNKESLLSVTSKEGMPGHPIKTSSRQPFAHRQVTTVPVAAMWHKEELSSWRNNNNLDLMEVLGHS